MDKNFCEGVVRLRLRLFYFRYNKYIEPNQIYLTNLTLKGAAKMLCDSCIKQLATNLSRESQTILSALTLSPLNKEQIGKKANLTFAITQRAMKELEGTQFVRYQEQGRSKVFQLSDSGKRLMEIYREELSRS